MPEPRTEHPATERLVAFADGVSPDPREIEAHLDVCEECASAVLIARQVACMSKNGLIPALSAAERETHKDRLRRSLDREQQGRSAADQAGLPKGSMPTPQPKTSHWTLGALAGALGFGHASLGPKPVLAGSESVAPPAAAHPPEPGSHPAAGPDADSQETGHPGVMSGHDSASHPHGENLSPPGDVAELLKHVQDLLGTAVPDAHDSEHSMESDLEHHADSASGVEHGSHHDPAGPDGDGHGDFSDAIDHSTDAAHEDHTGHDHPDDHHDDHPDDHAGHDDGQQDHLDHGGGSHHG